jgi:anion-transporting  ArsA/GET3 family ATPase
MLSWPRSARGGWRVIFVKKSLKKGATVIVMGPGGVGKTTVAAAIGLVAASQGLTTGVITVDPARRLRDALGLAALNAQPTLIDPKRLRDAGLDPGLQLSAMVLDVQRTWDGLVEHFVPSAATRQRIFANSFYRGLSGQFAGAEAYAALEQFYELRLGGAFETIVVDTPPAAHTFEFIEAPANLMRLLDSRAARWLLASRDESKRSPLALAGTALQFVATQLERFAGVKMLSAVGEFLAATIEAADTLSHRFHMIADLLRSRSVEFVLVTTAEPSRLAEAREVIKRMEADGLRLRTIVLNRLLDERSFASLCARREALPVLRASAALRMAIAADPVRDPKIEALARFFDQRATTLRTRIEAAAAFAQELPTRIELIVAPEFDAGIGDLGGIKRVADVLALGGGRRILANAVKAVKVTPQRMADDNSIPPSCQFHSGTQ